MEQFLGFALPGVPYGCTYALVAVCLVLTYQATGRLQLRLRGAGLRVGLRVHLADPVPQLVRVRGVRGVGGGAGPGHGLGLRPPPVPAHPERQLDGEDGVQPGLAGWHSRRCSRSSSGPRTSTPPRPSCPSSTPTSCTSPILGTPINGIYLSTISVTIVVLILLTVLLRYTSLGLQMRAAVESRRLVQLDGVNANGVVAIAWVVSSFMAGLAGVLLAPVYGPFNSKDYATLMVTAIAAAAWALLRSMPIAAGVAVLIGVVTTVAAGVHTAATASSTPRSCPSLPFFVPGGRACSSCRACASLDAQPRPHLHHRSTPAPDAATTRAPSMDRIIRRSCGGSSLPPSACPC